MLFLYFSIAFIFVILIIYLLSISLFTSTIHVKENMSVFIKKPQSLPSIKMGTDIFKSNAFCVLNGNRRNKFRILYSNSDSKEYSKLLIITNQLFFESNDKKFELYTSSSDVKDLTLTLFKIIPDFDTSFGVPTVRNTNINILSESKNTESNHLLSTFFFTKNRVMLALLLKDKDMTQHLTSKFSGFQTNIFDYMSHINLKKLDFLYPYSKINIIDVKAILPQKTELSNIYKVLCFEEIVYTHNDFTNNQVVNLLKEFYYRQSFNSDLDKASLNLYEKLGFLIYDEYKSIESFKQIEASKKQPIKITVNKNVSVFLIDYAKFLIKVFTSECKFIAGVQLYVNDVVELNKQTNDFENGTYKVFKSFDDKIVLSNGLILNWDELTMRILRLSDRFRISLLEIQYNNAFIYDNRDVIDVHMDVYIKHPVDLYGKIIEINTGKYILVSLYNYPEEKLNKKNEQFECIGKPSTKTKSQCEDEYNISGEKKKNIGIWDRRCVHDTECPFFEKNDNKYKGGCNNGYCEMPLGVKRLGFRQYEHSKDSYPFCKNCDFSDMQECCQRKKMFKDNNIYVFSN